MTSSRSVREQLQPEPVRLRPEARRRALLAGLVFGPLSTAGFGFTFVGIPQLLDGALASGWVFSIVGVLSIALAVVVGIMLLRPHHRGARVALQSVVLVGLPLAVLAPTIVASVILRLTVGADPTAAPQQWLVYLLSWLAVAAPGLVLGPLATWWVAHLNRFLPSQLARDEDVVARYEATTMSAQ